MSKPTLSLSPSIIEHYRTCKFGRYGNSLKTFIENKPRQKTDAQSRGDAYHLLIQYGPDKYQQLQQDGSIEYVIYEPQLDKHWVFREPQAAPAIATHFENEGKQCEVWGNLQIETTAFNVRVPLRVDAILRPDIWDYKCVSKEPYMAGYATAIQWPLYMMAFPECTRFHYKVFQVTTNGCAESVLTLERSEQAQKDALNWLYDLCTFIEKNDLQARFNYNRSNVVLQ